MLLTFVLKLIRSTCITLLVSLFFMCQCNRRICFCEICVNSIEYVKLKTHGTFTRMDSIAILRWYGILLLLLLYCLLFFTPTAALRNGHGKKKWSLFQCVHNMISFFEVCMRERENCFCVGLLRALNLSLPEVFGLICVIQQRNTIRTLNETKTSKYDHTMQWFESS